MFEKFGEFDSAEELNRAAAGLKEEGDSQALIDLALENGLEKGDAEDYEDGYCEELATQIMAAFGKIKIECEELKPQEIMQDWIEYIKAECTDSVEMRKAVRKKGKSIKGCIAELLKWSFGHQIPIDQEILKAAGVNASCVTLGIPGMGKAKELIRSYYLEESNGTKETVK